MNCSIQPLVGFLPFPTHNNCWTFATDFQEQMVKARDHETMRHEWKGNYFEIFPSFHHSFLCPRLESYSIHRASTNDYNIHQ